MQRVLRLTQFIKRIIFIDGHNSMNTIIKEGAVRGGSVNVSAFKTSKMTTSYQISNRNVSVIGPVRRTRLRQAGIRILIVFGIWILKLAI